jgi:aminoglycoside phosphotransferase family enzyme/predicted kinase
VTGPAGLVETHSAVVVFLGDRAYKLKKPVDLGFLDFTSREARAAACRREVELNRRLAPDVYLGVADVVDADGQPCDHLVVMQRMPDERRLSTCVERGEDPADALRLIARQIGVLHAATPSDPAWAPLGAADHLAQLWDDGFEVMERDADDVLDRDVRARARRLVARYIEGRGPLFDARVAAGWIRDGHGDLRADDIFLLPDGPRVLDCLDFDDELRRSDVLLDVAFLAMDLEQLGRPDLARMFLEWHREFSADTWPDSLAHHFIAYRAHVRAKVAAVRCAQGDDTAADDGRRHLELELRHLERGGVRLVLVGGPPGTGKSTLAAALADDGSEIVLRTDELRPGERGGGASFGAGRYAPAAVRATYDVMLDEARTLLSMGESVLLDASWRDPGQRAAARRVARETSSDLVELRCDAPWEIVRDRVAGREQEGVDASEAGVEVARTIGASFPIWPEAKVIDTSTDVATSRRVARNAISDRFT